MNTQITSQFDKTLYQGQPFHLVTPCPWPLLLSFALLILTVGAVKFFNGYSVLVYGITLLSLGFIPTVFSIILWFRDITTLFSR